MRTNKLDEIDKLLLEILSENARLSYVELGKLVNLSRVAVKTRIENLEKRGIIDKYTIELNLRKLGRSVAAFFDIEVVPSKIFEVAEILSQKECVTDVYHMTGPANLHMHAMLELDEELSDFLEKELYVIDGIEKVNSRLILSRFKARSGTKL